MNINLTSTCLTALFMLGCGASPARLDPSSAQRLAAAESPGLLVYSGQVVPHGATTPVFEYVRHVDQRAERRISTHVTRRIDGSPVLWQQATHDAGYRLRTFTEIHGQTGVTGRLSVSAGQLRLTRTRNGETENTVLPAGLPVVVGPTLFGFIQTHRARLAAGATVAFQFALPDQLATYVFEVRRTHADDSRTTFEVRPRSWWVGLAIEPMYVVFDRAGRAIEYRGRIPPRGPNLETLDARVTYRSATPRFL
jgi:hypothetical protein